MARVGVRCTFVHVEEDMKAFPVMRRSASLPDIRDVLLEKKRDIDEVATQCDSWRSWVSTATWSTDEWDADSESSSFTPPVPVWTTEEAFPCYAHDGALTTESEWSVPAVPARPQKKAGIPFRRSKAHLVHSEGLETSLMFKQLPKEISADEILYALDSRGFAGTYDFFYLPLNFDTGRNLGYAFVNFTEHDIAVDCMDLFQDFAEWSVESRPCRVQWSQPHQGLEAHVERYRNSTVMHQCVPDVFKPRVFENGVRMVYPAPTSAVRRPRCRGFFQE